MRAEGRRRVVGSRGIVRGGLFILVAAWCAVLARIVLRVRQVDAAADRFFLDRAD